MASWTTRIGLIVPDVNVVVEPELSRALPSNVSMHVSRVRYDFGLEDPLGDLISVVPRCARQLSKANVHGVALACTGASFYRGCGSDLDIGATIQSITGVPSTTASTAVINSLKRVSAKSISLATPYDDWVNVREEKFIKDNGINVDSVAGLGIRDGGRISEFNASDARRIALQVDCRSADVLFISCTNFETFRIIRELQDEIGKPVLTSNLSTLWELLYMVGHPKGESYEQLLTLL